MGAVTKLYISRKWELEDIKTVMENYLDLKERKKTINKRPQSYKIDVINTSVLEMTQFNFTYNNNLRTMAIFTHSDFAENYYGLHLGHNDEAIEIMTKIANVLGGLLESNDCGENGVEKISGMLHEDDGLAYFIKYSILHNELKDENDLIGLNKSIHKWHDNIPNADRSKMNLFPKEV